MPAPTKEETLTEFIVGAIIDRPLVLFFMAKPVRL